WPDLEPTKTKLVEFGRFAQRHAAKHGRKRPETISGVHALLYAEPEGQLQDRNAHREISLAAQSHVVAGPAATNPALDGPGAGQHPQRRAQGPLRLLRHCRKLSFPAKGPSCGRTLLAQNAGQRRRTLRISLDWRCLPSLRGKTVAKMASLF